MSNLKSLEKKVSKLNKSQKTFKQDGGVSIQISKTDLDTFREEYENLNCTPSDPKRIIILTDEE